NLSSVYSLFSFFLVPFLVFVIPRIYFSLHPDLIKSGKFQMEGPILYTFLSTLLGFTLLFFLIYKLAFKVEYYAFRKENQNE
ncbi:MAG: cytochrome C biogenesis protein, partial [Thermoanaerobaculia bacterium]